MEDKIDLTACDKIINLTPDSFKSIGYKSNLIKKNYEYSDFLVGNNPPLRHTDIAVFGREPLDYRSACFAIKHLPNDIISSKIAAQHLRAFGAVNVIICQNGKSEIWKNEGKTISLYEEIRTQELPKYIIKKKSKWNPENVIRLKSHFPEPESQQIDFVDIGLLQALEKEASQKIDSLIKRILYNTENIFKKNKLAFDARKIFRITFSLLTGKLLKDRDIFKNLDFNDPNSVFKVVSNYYSLQFKNISNSFPKNLLENISEEIANAFSFKNLSIDTFTYIYENTFVSEERRKSLGIHSTPSYLADYVLSKIPIEELNRSEWHVLDPMSGHGIFLIAAMRRIRELLPQDWGGKKRHKFFLEHLYGVEIDDFSVEVARLCLMLADFPEPDGWNIINSDVFKKNILENLLPNTHILVGNPPFECIENHSPSTPKPKELLKRSLPLLPNNSFLGLILPHSFIDGNDYKNERQLLIDNFDIINITKLPDRIFRYSDMETAIVIARKGKNKTSVLVNYGVVNDSEREDFRINNTLTWSDKVENVYFKNKQKGNLFVPVLRKVWDYLEDNLRINDIADIHLGVQYRPGVSNDIDNVIKTKPFKGAKKAIYNVTHEFRQFVIGESVYIDCSENLRRKGSFSKAWERAWENVKIALPASRLSRNPWRYAAAIDYNGIILSRRFYGVWLKKEEISIELLSAVLNSPLAMAYVYAHSFSKDIPIRVYKSIPIPFDLTSKNNEIKNLVKKYIAFEKVDSEEGKKILLQIDAEILKLFDLPPKLERSLLDLFWNYRRHVPFNFNGYISPEMKSWIPLYIYISDQYSNSSPQNILKKFPTIHDNEIIELLKNAGR